MNLEETFREHRRLSALAAETVTQGVAKAIELAAATTDGGGRVFACGNGGSAADSEHFVAELVGRASARGGPLAAMALTANTAVVTAIANDFGYERVFAHQLEAWGRRGDLLLAISTSGDSSNVVAAAREARRLGLTVVALTGDGGGRLGREADVLIAVPSRDVHRVQEVHSLCLHAIAGAVGSG